MSTVEDRLREALAERAAQSPIDPGAWDKAVAKSRHRLLPWRWSAWTVRLAPAAGVVAAVAVIIAATLVGVHLGGGAKPAGSLNTNGSPSTVPSPNSVPSPGTTPSPSAAPPKGAAYLVHEIPPVTPYVSISLFADGHQVKNDLWFGYVPGHAAAGIALCQYNESGAYTGYSACTSGRLAPGTLARPAGTDGTGQIRLGVVAARATSVTALLAGGKTARGTVRSVPGVSYKVWEVGYPADSGATLVFRDAAGYQVTRLIMPKTPPTPSRPSTGGITLFHTSDGPLTAYRISGGRIGFWQDHGSTWSDRPVSQSALSVIGTGATGKQPDQQFGYAPTGTARVVLQLSDGRRFASRTISGWPGSGVVFWGPVTLPAHTALDYDTIVITYDSAGHVLREVPLVFLQ
jgi:hypothetical protein